ncbi:MAG: FAD-dependent oxidoreductase [Deltaproteobacteria bacterium]|nr:FAD-dependent oxidoreductase [Deltaproteobacteria bacterium]
MSGKAQFEMLLSPFFIGKMRIKNRIIKTAAEMNTHDPIDAHMNQRTIDYVEAVAKGGAGMVILWNAYLDYPLGARMADGLRIDTDEYIPGFIKLAEAVHKYDCKLSVQMMHAGPWCPAALAGRPPIAASVMQEEVYGFLSDETAEATLSEIADIQEKFVKAAERLKQAGVDHLEIHCGTQHLGNTFMSRHWNKRNDQYGPQSVENRARFMVEIIQKMKTRLGKDFPLGVLYNAAEYGIDDGITAAEGQEFGRLFEAAGADNLHPKADGIGPLYSLINWPEAVCYPEVPDPLPKELDGSKSGAGFWVPLAALVKKAVKIPVIATAGIDAEMGEKILSEGKADFIGMTRRLLADPELPNKVAEGRLDDIAPCTRCLSCIEAIHTNYIPGLPGKAYCRINASLTKEGEYEIKPADKKKKVMVVGGGPAGMEAARVAALRGHDVTLYEKEHYLGGSVPVAATIKGLDIEDLPALVRYLHTQITKLGVKINLGKEVNRAFIEKLKPDVLILATGGLYSIPEIPGINSPKVVKAADLNRRLKTFLRFFNPRLLIWATKLWMPIGNNVVIIGGGIHGLQTAVFLTKRGRKVTVVETAEKMGKMVIENHKVRLFGWLEQKGVILYPGVKYEEITDKGLTITTKEGERKTLAADTILPTLPMLQDTELIKILKGAAPEIYQIGDCSNPALIIDAIGDGSYIGRTI